MGVGDLDGEADDQVDPGDPKAGVEEYPSNE